MRLARLLVTVIVATAVVAAVALAAPNRTGEVTRAQPYAWDGGPVNGANETASVSSSSCSLPASGCDFTLLHTTEPGQLTVAISGDSANSGSGDSTDIDLYLYASDKDGTQGDPLKSSTGSTADESVVYDATPGYYLVVVSPATAVNAVYKGKALLGQTPADPAAIDFGPDPTPPPNGSGSGSGSGSGGGGQGTATYDLAPTTHAGTPRKRPVRRLSGTASDSDGHVAYVDVAVVRVSGKTCRSLTARGAFVKTACKSPRFVRARGTKRWHLSLKHALGKGRYVLYARATDNVGRVDAGFGPANRRSFTVR